jgi:dihydroorotase
MSQLIRGARLIDPANGFDGTADLLVEDGRIARIGDCLDPADNLIEGAGLWLIPGLVDLSARMGPTRGVTALSTETAAAASGGITTVCCPPDGQPVIDNSAAAYHLRDRVSAGANIKVTPIGALTVGLAGERLSDMHALAQAGCAGVGNSRAPMHDTHVLRNAMQYAASLDLTVYLSPVDPWLAGAGMVHEGRVATRHGLAGIPAAAEVAAVARDLVLIQDTGVRAHFERLSCGESVRLIERAREDGLPVTADVAAHQLFLTELDVSGFDARCHVRPPLRSQDDRDALRLAVAKGSVDAICSDHTPLDRDAKLAPFPDTEPGISALETLLALGLRLVEEEVLSLSDLVQRLSATPARILNSDAGHLGMGATADLALIDPDAVWTLKAEQLLSNGKCSPFDGWEFRGQVVGTWVAGKRVFQRQES